MGGQYAIRTTLLTASDAVKISADTERYWETADGYHHDVKGASVTQKGTVRVKFDGKTSKDASDGAYGNCSFNIKKNGTVVQNWSFRNKTYATYSYDVSVADGDTLSLEILAINNAAGLNVPYVKNFRICFDRAAVAQAAITQD